MCAVPERIRRCFNGRQRCLNGGGRSPAVKNIFERSSNAPATFLWCDRAFRHTRLSVVLTAGFGLRLGNDPKVEEEGHGILDASIRAPNISYLFSSEPWFLMKSSWNPL